MFEFLILSGVLVLMFALRSYTHPVFFRLSILCLPLMGALIGWFLFEHWVAVVVGLVAWLVLPTLEIFVRVGRLRIPKVRQLRPMRAPSDEEFPMLDDLTEEVQREGFKLVDDVGWDFEDLRQFYRLFYREEDRALATIALQLQGPSSFYHVSIVSRSKDDHVWMTWNYPFALTMKLPPHLKVNRQRPELPFFDMHQNHLGFLALAGMNTDQLREQDPDDLSELLQKDISSQIDHNLKAGLLVLENEEQVRYSWRGLAYIFFQFLRDLVRVR
ncbi:MAG: hypothetical protein ACFCU3_12090 [Verrucomicrobiales bacterium]